jgi:DNA-binding transcriptional ArsR family regulator
VTTTVELVPSPLEAPAEAARQWAPVLKALGDPVRLEIALVLAHRPHTVKELQEALGHSQALVSHHLRLLREQGIVTSNPRGRANVYEICTGPLACLAQCLAVMVASGDAGCDCPNPDILPG